MKKIIKIIKQLINRDVTIDVSLKCPDRLYESLGYDLPSQFDEFINFINTFSQDKNYTIKLKKFYPLEALAKLKSEIK